MTRPSAEELKKMTDSIIEAITSDEFLERMEEIRKSSIDDRLLRARDLLSIDGLRQAGVNLPDGMRVSSRYFEEGVGLIEFGNIDELHTSIADTYDPIITLKDGSSAKHAGPIIMGTCGGAGAGTVCACGGSC